jgi:hypothetical protein
MLETLQQQVRRADCWHATIAPPGFLAPFASKALLLSLICDGIFWHSSSNFQKEMLLPFSRFGEDACVSVLATACSAPFGLLDKNDMATQSVARSTTCVCCHVLSFWAIGRAECVCRLWASLKSQHQHCRCVGWLHGCVGGQLGACEPPRCCSYQRVWFAQIARLATHPILIRPCAILPCGCTRSCEVRECVGVQRWMDRRYILSVASAQAHVPQRHSHTCGCTDRTLISLGVCRAIDKTTRCCHLPRAPLQTRDIEQKMAIFVETRSRKL